MITMGKVDTSDLMMIITWAIDIPFQSPKLKWVSWTHTTPYIVMTMIIVLHCKGQWHVTISREFEILWHPPVILIHDDVIKWKHFPNYWPFVWGIHRSSVNSPHKGQWRGALMFCLICTRINGWVNNGEAGDLRCYRAHYDVIVMNTFRPPV